MATLAQTWLAEHELEELPSDISAIKATSKGVVNENWRAAPEEHKRVCSTRQHPQLTYGSVLAQKGERGEIDVLGEVVVEN